MLVDSLQEAESLENRFEQLLSPAMRLQKLLDLGGLALKRNYSSNELLRGADRAIREIQNWRLNFGESNPAIEDVRQETEDFQDQYPDLPGLFALSVFGNRDKVVFIGKYKKDPEYPSEATTRTHQYASPAKNISSPWSLLSMPLPNEQLVSNLPGRMDKLCFSDWSCGELLRDRVPRVLFPWAASNQVSTFSTFRRPQATICSYEEVNEQHRGR